MIETWKQKIAAFAKGWVGSFIIAILLATSIKSAIADWYVVPTGSMIPTIIEGDRIFVNKLAYDFKIPYSTHHISVWDNPQRGDIVVFHSPADEKRLVKRVVGLPGDMISLDSNRLYINGSPVTYEVWDISEKPDLLEKVDGNQSVFSEKFPKRSHTIMVTYDNMKASYGSFLPIKVPENCYYMMGDNRDNSADSRFFGFVERKRILGRATTIVMSLNPDRHYYPRWDRFFSKLD